MFCDRLSSLLFPPVILVTAVLFHDVGSYILNSEGAWGISAVQGVSADKHVAVFFCVLFGDLVVTDIFYFFYL